MQHINRSNSNKLSSDLPPRAPELNNIRRSTETTLPFQLSLRPHGPTLEQYEYSRLRVKAEVGADFKEKNERFTNQRFDYINNQLLMTLTTCILLYALLLFISCLLLYVKTLQY